MYIPYFKLAIPFFSRFNLNRDVESQLNEMRRPLLNQMVELWKTMGLTHLQEARIDPMLGYFKGKYLCTLHPLCFISNRSETELVSQFSNFDSFAYFSTKISVALLIKEIRCSVVGMAWF